MSYTQRVKEQIKVILSRPQKEDVPYDILDNEEDKEAQLIALKIKQRQMKYGEIWQVIIGEYPTFKNLKVGNKLDVISEKRKIAIELKNRNNTDNASSRKTNLDKLAHFKSENPEYTCIYGVINDNIIEGKNKKIVHKYNNAEYDILYLSGDELFSFIFQKNKVKMLDFIKRVMRTV